MAEIQVGIPQVCDLERSLSHHCPSVQAQTEEQQREAQEAAAKLAAELAARQAEEEASQRERWRLMQVGNL